MKLVKKTADGLKIKPLSRMIKESRGPQPIDMTNKSLVRVNEAVEWPSEEEDKKAISVLNRWMYELLNNGGGNAQDEKHRSELWYFSPSFKDYIGKALAKIDELGLTEKMPLTVEWAKNNLDDLVPVLGQDAANAYDEIKEITNWDALQMDDLDFVKSAENPKQTPYDVDDEDEEEYDDADEAVNENYGEELDKLQIAFDQVVSAMKGSSAADPKAIWIDLGLRNQFCDEEGNLI